MDDYDLIVVGAGKLNIPIVLMALPHPMNPQYKTPANPAPHIGFHGLSMAKTYLEASPSSRLLILDSASSIGGDWASHRLYPGLKSNNILGTYEFSQDDSGRGLAVTWMGIEVA